MHLFRFRRVALAVAVVSLATVGAVPAHATNYLCDAVNGAPAIAQISDTDFRAYYYHQCNGDPGANGVTQMNESIGVTFPDGHWEKVTYVDRTQQSAAFNVSGTVYQSGYYTPFMELDIFGAVSYGSMPGECGRPVNNPDHVHCRWNGTAKYFARRVTAVDVGDLPVVAFDPVQEDPTGIATAGIM